MGLDLASAECHDVHGMAPTLRDQKFQLRLAEDERRMLEAIAERDGLSAADIVRQLVRREYAAGFGAERTGPKRKPKPRR